jgi:hypothetical protein
MWTIGRSQRVEGKKYRPIVRKILYVVIVSFIGGGNRNTRLDLQLPMQSVPITTKFVNSNPAHGQVYSIQHYVIKFVSYLRQVCGFLRVFRFPPPIKLTITTYSILRTIGRYFFTKNIDDFNLIQKKNLQQNKGIL